MNCNTDHCALDLKPMPSHIPQPNPSTHNNSRRNVRVSAPDLRNCLCGCPTRSCATLRASFMNGCTPDAAQAAPPRKQCISRNAPPSPSHHHHSHRHMYKLARRSTHASSHRPSHTPGFAPSLSRNTYIPGKPFAVIPAQSRCAIAAASQHLLRSTQTHAHAGIPCGANPSKHRCAIAATL